MRTRRLVLALIVGWGFAALAGLSLGSNRPAVAAPAVGCGVCAEWCAGSDERRGPGDGVRSIGDGEPDWTLTGEGGSDLFALSVSTAGDVNGDDYSDVIVGGYYYNSGQGRVYVYGGGASGLSITPIFSATGAGTNDHFGHPVASAGDVNNDGYDDIIVGEYAYDYNRGRVFVYAGAASGASSTPIFTGTGEAFGDYYGLWLAGAGDVDDDGYDDIVVGAYAYDSYRGRVYVYAGGAGGLASTPVLTLTGPGPSCCLGNRLATAGDVNSDGYADVVVGASCYNNNQGRAWVYAGGESGLSAKPIFTQTGEAPGDGFGGAVGGAGDVNGDGYSDLLIGASGYGGDRGRVYLYRGGISGVLETAAFTATGEAAGDRFGTGVATAGDVNSDGYADVVVGAPFCSSERGRVYLYAGGAAGLGLTPIFTATGEDTGEDTELGISVSTAGDVDGDGCSDVIAGAWRYDTSEYCDVGRAYVYAGMALPYKVYLPLVLRAH
jgi:hypothetical protein